MAANKDKMMMGVNYIAYSFPLIFLGPGIFFWKGAKAWDQGEWWWAVLSIVIMGLAVFLIVKGLRLLLAGLFGDK